VSTINDNPHILWVRHAEFNLYTQHGRDRARKLALLILDAVDTAEPDKAWKEGE